MQFNLTDKDMVKVEKFRKAQNKKNGTSYYGAIGGELTYSFTPNGIGCVITVKHESTGAELDLTDVSEW